MWLSLLVPEFGGWLPRIAFAQVTLSPLLLTVTALPWHVHRLSEVAAHEHLSQTGHADRARLG